MADDKAFLEYIVKASNRRRNGRSYYNDSK
ncbi:MAG: hypothetical protein US00_C0007G0024 [Candidatus Nomurabacteria bacterium GW2011_GWF2_36_126]|nr:MAG: hypothetical protein US00_C0007G0024 [Candidatus Nomurabacteria bacterium GW2011_GWF2_36_126]